MIKSTRLKDMETYILERGDASMEELCQLYDISMNTCRNDVAELVERGTIKKVYGGVTSNVSGKSSSLVSIDERKTQNVQCKRDIAKAAAEYIDSGDIIFIDSGSTAVNIIDYLDGKGKLTIISHSLEVINRASKLMGVEVFCFGGRYQSSTNCFVGMDAGEFLNNFNITKAFMGTKGITADGSITDSSIGEFEIKKWAVSKASKVILLADSHKFLRAGLMSYTNLDKVDILVSDRMANDELINLCETKNVNVRLV